MPTVDLALERATAGDRERVVDLLATAGLPTADVPDGADPSAGPTEFYLASTPSAPAGTAPVAVGGLEPHGDAALVRSVAVRPERRGEGVGRTLVAALERRAADAGVETLVLLTTDAADFFAAAGYDRIDRTAIPASLRDTEQVASICPASATVMRKRL